MTSSASREARPYHHGALRETLLSRAAEVIGEHGIEALTLRGLARDLGVSHGAPNRHFRSREELLTTLATEAWTQALDATLERAKMVGEDPWIRLNAMGRGYLTWALSNRALFAVVSHPDVNRYADEALRESVAAFQAVISDAVADTQRTGRHPEIDPAILTLYTNAVPFGAAMLLANPFLTDKTNETNLDELVADIIELVVPVFERLPGPNLA